MGRTPLPGPLNYLARHPSALLLLIQLLGVLLYPWMENTSFGRTLFGAFGLVVLGATLRLVRRSAAQAWIGFLLAAVVLSLPPAGS